MRVGITATRDVPRQNVESVNSDELHSIIDLQLDQTLANSTMGLKAPEPLPHAEI